MEARRATDLVDALRLSRAPTIWLEHALVDVVAPVVSGASKADGAWTASAARLKSTVHTGRSTVDIRANRTHITIAIIRGEIQALVNIDTALHAKSRSKSSVRARRAVEAAFGVDAICRSMASAVVGQAFIDIPTRAVHRGPCKAAVARPFDHRPTLEAGLLVGAFRTWIATTVILQALVDIDTHTCGTTGSRAGWWRTRCRERSAESESKQCNIPLASFSYPVGQSEHLYPGSPPMRLIQSVFGGHGFVRHSLMSSHFPVTLLRTKPAPQASNPTQLNPITSFPVASRPFWSEGRFWHCLMPQGLGAGFRPVSASNSHSLISMQPLGPYPSPRYPFGHGSHEKPLPQTRGRALRSAPQSGMKFLHLTFGEHAATAREHSSTSLSSGVQPEMHMEPGPVAEHGQRST
jgi:hypothetical protein